MFFGVVQLSTFFVATMARVGQNRPVELGYPTAQPASPSTGFATSEAFYTALAAVLTLTAGAALGASPRSPPVRLHVNWWEGKP